MGGFHLIVKLAQHIITGPSTFCCVPFQTARKPQFRRAAHENAVIKHVAKLWLCEQENPLDNNQGPRVTRLCGCTALVSDG